MIERRHIISTLRDPATWEFRTRTDYVITALERVPLGVPYPEMVERVRDTLQLLPATRRKTGKALGLVHWPASPEAGQYPTVKRWRE